MGRFRFLQHTADGLVEVVADDERDLLSTSAKAMFALMVNIADIERNVSRDICAEGGDLQELLMNFIKELIFLYSIKNELYSDFNIKMIEKENKIIVNAVCYGESIDPEKHTLGGEVKMLTYHNYKVERMKDGRLKAILLFDM